VEVLAWESSRTAPWAFAWLWPDPNGDTNGGFGFLSLLLGLRNGIVL
jgi:hypothetical protein